MNDVTFAHSDLKIVTTTEALPLCYNSVYLILACNNNFV